MDETPVSEIEPDVGDRPVNPEEQHIANPQFVTRNRHQAPPKLTGRPWYSLPHTGLGKVNQTTTVKAPGRSAAVAVGNSYLANGNYGGLLAFSSRAYGAVRGRPNHSNILARHTAHRFMPAAGDEQRGTAKSGKLPYP